MNAGTLFRLYLLSLLICQAVLLACDTWLWLTGRETVSMWLRSHPLWYHYTLAIATFVATIVFIHLFRGVPPAPR